MPIYPVQHLSYSALSCFLADPHEFKRVYIDKAKRPPDKPAMMVGKAVHKALELYYNGMSLENAITGAEAYLIAGAEHVDWGLTGSLDKAMSEFKQTVDHYFAEDPHYEEAKVVETEVIMERKPKGIPIILKAVADLRLPVKKTIVDFKKVQSLTDVATDGVPGKYVAQAVFNYLASDWKPEQFIYHEIKTSKNKDGSPQTQQIILDFRSDEMKENVEDIKSLIKSVCKLISKKTFVYLPNIGDMMNGNDSWREWKASKRTSV